MYPMTDMDKLMGKLVFNATYCSLEDLKNKYGLDIPELETEQLLQDPQDFLPNFDNEMTKKIIADGFLNSVPILDIEENLTEEPTEEEYAQFVFMRTDLASMSEFSNRGRMVAQAVHAGSYMADAFSLAKEFGFEGEFEGLEIPYDDWVQSGNGFGVVYVYGVDQKTMEDLFIMTQEYFKGIPFFYDIMTDPDYAISDGNSVHRLPVDTCSIAFAPKEKMRTLLTTLGINLYSK